MGADPEIRLQGGIAVHLEAQTVEERDHKYSHITTYAGACDARWNQFLQQHRVSCDLRQPQVNRCLQSDLLSNHDFMYCFLKE